MKPSKEIITSLTESVKKQGIRYVMNASSLSYRTIINVTSTGECYRPQYLKIISYLKNEKSKQKRLLTLTTD